MQPNVPTQTGSWECGWILLKYFDMYIQQRFVVTETKEFEVVSNIMLNLYVIVCLGVWFQVKGYG